MVTVCGLREPSEAKVIGAYCPEFNLKGRSAVQPRRYFKGVLGSEGIALVS